MEAESFGDWLKRVRTEKGFTQKGLVEAANNVCTDAYVSSLERKQDVSKKGRPTRPDIEIVDALALALGVPLEVARQKAGYSPPEKVKTSGSSASEPVESVEEALRIAHTFEGHGLSESEIRQLRPLMEILDREIDRLAGMNR